MGKNLSGALFASAAAIGLVATIHESIENVTKRNFLRQKIYSVAEIKLDKDKEKLIYKEVSRDIEVTALIFLGLNTLGACYYLSKKEKQ